VSVIWLTLAGRTLGPMLFDVECECGAEFRVPSGEAKSGEPTEGWLLVPLVGRCPRCGLRLEEVEPFGRRPLRRPS
jgi:hypothetical protein